MRHRSWRAPALAIATLIAATAGIAVGAAPANAAPRVSITVADRPALASVADTSYLTEVTVSGSGFQSIQNGFGGIYVLFGWVDPAGWAPSAGGHTGSDYRYVYDDETNPVGYQLFVSFPGSSTQYANNGGTITADGGWSATMKIPGATFQAYDRTGAVSEVDCTVVQCGIITIGAHGVLNSANETFTPISFQQIYTAADGRQTTSAAAAPNTAVAPTIIGGRPATIPAALPIDGESAVAIEAQVGETRVTLTVPGADPDAWLGIYFYSEPLFAGWFKPSSTGSLDVNIPANLAYGDHNAVVYDPSGTLVGWAEFSHDEPAVAAEPTAAVPVPEQTPLLLPIIIAAALLAALAVAFLLWALRRRRVSTSSAPSTNS